MAEDQGQAWDRIIRSCQTSSQSSSEKAKPAGIAPLKLQPEPRRIWLPELPRSPGLIHPNLRADIRSAISGQSPWPLVITGAVGAGKTCAALCLLDYAYGMYFTTSSLCQSVNLAQQGKLMVDRGELRGWEEVNVQVFWRDVATKPLVVLDELGLRTTITEPHYDAVKSLIDARAGKPFVVISNLAIRDIAQVYGERVLSRLAAGTLVDIQDRDRRLHP